MSRPVLIYRCPDAFGLGATLVMIAAYAAYCRRHAMSLALDMRRFHYFSADPHASFFNSFEIAGDLPIVTDLDEIGALSRAPDRAIVGSTMRLLPDQPPPARVVDVQGVINRKLAPWFAVAPPPGFAVRLHGALRETVENALRRRAWDNAAGVHFRHGNGEFLQSREDFLTTPDYRERVTRFEDEMVRRVTATACGREVFVAGDNREFVARMLRDVPRAFTLGTPIPDVPYTEYIREVGGERALAEAAIDLWALASCQDVVCVRSSFAEAIAIIDPAVRLDVVDAFARGEVGDAQGAVHRARLVLLADPANGTAWSRLSATLGEAGQRSEAEACAAAATEAGDLAADSLKALLLDAAGIGALVSALTAWLGQGSYEAHAARNMVRMLVNAGLPELGEPLLRAASGGNPGDARLQALLADILDRQGKWTDALIAARRAVELAPGNANYRLALARAQHRAGDSAARESLAGAAAMLKKDRTT